MSNGHKTVFYKFSQVLFPISAMLRNFRGFELSVWSKIGLHNAYAYLSRSSVTLFRIQTWTLPPRPFPKKTRAEHFKRKIVIGTRWNKLRPSRWPYEHHVHKSLLYSYDQHYLTAMPAAFKTFANLWQRVVSTWLTKKPQLFWFKTYWHSAKIYEKLTLHNRNLDFNILPVVKAAFSKRDWLLSRVYLGSFIETKISLFLFPRIETKMRTNQISLFACKNRKQYTLHRSDWLAADKA